MMSIIDGKSMLEVLRDFVQKAERLDISYMVTGSFAMSAYGEMRFTRDIDIVIEMEAARVDEFFRLFERDFYISKNSVRRAVGDQSMFNLIHLEKAVKIDCTVRNQTDFERLKFANRRQVTIGDLIFWTITKEDLILSKLNWAKSSAFEMQIRDVANLIAGKYDFTYVQKWIKELNLEEIWQKVLEWKTPAPK